MSGRDRLTQVKRDEIRDDAIPEYVAVAVKCLGG